MFINKLLMNIAFCLFRMTANAAACCCTSSFSNPSVTSVTAAICEAVSSFLSPYGHKKNMSSESLHEKEVCLNVAQTCVFYNEQRSA